MCIVEQVAFERVIEVGEENISIFEPPVVYRLTTRNPEYVHR
jgi:hypothetical protein